MKKNKQVKIRKAYRDTPHSILGTSAKHSLYQIVGAVSVVLLLVVFGYGYHCVTTKSCTVLSVRKLTANQVEIETSQGTIIAEVVDTPESRELGLSGRTGLAKDEGMLFVFDKAGRYGFWMKDMLFPLDMVWINEDGLVVNIERSVSPESYPKAYINTIDAKYVLELSQGATKTYGLYIGSKVTIKK
jgi:uncharacterized protein